MVSNETVDAYQLIARKLYLKEERDEIVFAPSVGNGRPILTPGCRPYVVYAAMVTDTPELPRVYGILEAINLRTGEKVRVTQKRTSFLLGNADEELGPSVLCSDDAKALALATELYAFSVTAKQTAVFRPDRIKNLSSEGCSLVNRFLIEMFRQNKAKLGVIDFNQIITKKYKCQIIRTTDHYFDKIEYSDDESIVAALYRTYVVVYNYWEVPTEYSADAELAQRVDELRKTYGFTQALIYLLRSASPEERALIPGMVESTLELQKLARIEVTQPIVAAQTPEKEDVESSGQGAPIPQLSAEDILAIQEIIRLDPWSERHEKANKKSPGTRDDRSPFEWIRDKFGKWMGRGLTTGHLIGDTGLYTSLMQRMSRARRGLGQVPEWFNVPVEKEEALRVAEPEKRGKIKIARELEAERKRNARRLRKITSPDI